MNQRYPSEVLRAKKGAFRAPGSRAAAQSREERELVLPRRVAQLIVRLEEHRAGAQEPTGRMEAGRLSRQGP